jgi:pimeloyl-ACP methyl ester carboxylesterase
VELKVIGPLTDPVAHGGQGRDAFHLILPTLPGFGFSAKPAETGWDMGRIADAWITLMDRLGYELGYSLADSPVGLAARLYWEMAQAGTTRNQALFYPRFDRIVLVSAPPEILAERLSTRTGNPYGKDPAELAETLQYQQTVEPLLRASATLEVVTTVPVTQVADMVLHHVL